MSFCTHCGSTVPLGLASCASCGRPHAATPSATTAPAALPANAPSQGVLIAGLLLNVLVLPGVGSLVAGAKEGWWQLGLALGGLVLIFTLIGAILGIPMMIGAWVWALVTSVKLLQGRPA